MNRTRYDACAYSKALGESVAPIHYLLDPIKYENCNRCRIELGVVGGTAVSHINGSLVDLENSLLGLDRPATRCPEYKWLPSDDDHDRLQGKEYIKPVCHPVVDTRVRHLKPCQMHDFPAVPHPPAPQPFKCGVAPPTTRID